MKIYVASSWKNPYYNYVVSDLRSNNFEVYSYREAISTEGKNTAFNWDQIDKNWKDWHTFMFLTMLNNELAVNAFNTDKQGMLDADVCVLILPSGNSSHLEAGFMKGLGKILYIYLPDDNKTRPELDYKLADGIFTKSADLVEELQNLQRFGKMLGYLKIREGK